MELHHEAEDGLGRVAARLHRLGLHPGDHVQVHPPGEIRFARGDDHAGDRVIGERRVHMGVELPDALLVQDVHRGVRQVPGDGGDAVGGLVAEDIGHMGL